MATSLRTGTKPKRGSGSPARPLIYIGLLVVLVGVVQELGGGRGLLGGTDTLGGGEHQLMVAGEDKDQLDDCAAEQVLQDKRCGDTKVVIIDATAMPFIARNISLAWDEGHLGQLTRDAPENSATKYRAACGKQVFTRRFPNGWACRSVFPDRVHSP